jgi:polar amino acid transport system substrate-binding protein
MRILKKETKIIAVLIYALLLFTPMTGNAETIRIATGEYPPWTSASLAQGGYINNVVKEAFSLYGVDVEFDYMPWKRALEATRLGQYHASSFWGESKERQKDFLHSDSIENIYFVFFYNKQRFKEPFEWQQLRDAMHYKVGATRSYTYTQEFWNLSQESGTRVSIANRDIDSLHKLVNGKIDLFPISEFTGKYLLHSNFSDNEVKSIGINSKPLSKGKNYILFSKKINLNAEYVKMLNMGLKKLQQQGKLKRFREELFK